MSGIRAGLNRLRGESSEASVYEKAESSAPDWGKVRRRRCRRRRGGPLRPQRTVKSAPPAALPESEGKAPDAQSGRGASWRAGG